MLAPARDLQRRSAPAAAGVTASWDPAATAITAPVTVAEPTGERQSPRVMLVQMPWAHAALPSLALGLLKSVLDRAGVACETLHANVHAVPFLGGVAAYDTMSVERCAEIAFGPYYFDCTPIQAAQWIGEILADAPVVQSSHAGDPAALIEGAGALLDWAMQAVDWGRFDLIGFSLTFQQTVPSLALAKRIKAAFPRTRIVFGGACCDGDMGPEMLRSFPEIDFVVSGEGDEALLALARALGQGEDAQPQALAAVRGLSHRDAEGCVISQGVAPLVRDLGGLPDPDYGEYFEAARPLVAQGLSPRLYVEQSRGCWYGQKQPCLFCGIPDMTFRRKSPEHALAEMLRLSARYRSSDFYMSDNILDHRFYTSLLPELARLRSEEGYSLTSFYEIKSNLRKEQIQAFHAAGVIMAQVGIESFDDEVLQAMKKGVRAIQQVQTLKHMQEIGIRPVWNIIYANPVENAAQYRRMIALLPSLHHLKPPGDGEVTPMILQRFSAYWRDPKRYGIRDIRPQDIYRRIFPRDGLRLDKLATFFDYDHDQWSDADLAAARADFLAAIDTWRQAFRPDLLTYAAGPGWVRIEDRRTPAGGGAQAQAIVLQGVQAALFRACDSAQLLRDLQTRFEDRADAASVAAFLDRLVELRLMMGDGKHYLSLPLGRAA